MRFRRKLTGRGARRQRLRVLIEKRVRGVAQAVGIDRVGMVEADGGAQLFGKTRKARRAVESVRSFRQNGLAEGTWRAESSALMSPKDSWKAAASMNWALNSSGRMASSTACPISWQTTSGLSPEKNVRSLTISWKKCKPGALLRLRGCRRR